MIFAANQGRISRGHDAVSQYIAHYLLNYLANIFFFFNTLNLDLRSIILICERIKTVDLYKRQETSTAMYETVIQEKLNSGNPDR